MHIALPEHLDVWMHEMCYGVKREGIGCPRVNSGFFSAMLEAGHTKGVFVGHDHVNDYWGRLYGIALGYGGAPASEPTARRTFCAAGASSGSPRGMWRRLTPTCGWSTGSSWTNRGFSTRGRCGTRPEKA